MSLAETLWRKYAIKSPLPTSSRVMAKDDFEAAIKEYGEAVREKAAGVCEDEYSCEGIAQRCAAAIKQMELP